MKTANPRLVCLVLACIFAIAGDWLCAQTPNRMTGSATSKRKIPQANRAPGDRPVRSASAQLYSETLAPGASNADLQPIPLPDSEFTYSEGDYLNPGCESCVSAAACCCNPTNCLLDWTRADLWMGVTSYSGPGSFLTTGSSSNGQVEGSFGFQEGFNFGSRLPCVLGGQLGAQLGMRFTHTQLDGSAAGPDNRTQAFLTAGLFRRVDFGFQGGLVVDYLHDDWIYQADLLQLRGELSFLLSPCHDLGFRFTDSQQIEQTTATVAGLTTPVDVRLSSLNTYRFFYRYRFGECGRGQTELQAGFTEDSGTILGVILKAPLQNQLGLEATATYLIPPKNIAAPYAQEGWNLGMAIVWTPGRVFGTARDYYRPLLDPADNGSLITRLGP